MFPKRFLLSLLIVIYCYSLTYGHGVSLNTTRIQGGSCETSLYLFLYTNTTCIDNELLSVEVFVDDVKVTPTDPTTGMSAELSNLSPGVYYYTVLDMEGDYRIEVSSNFSCIWSHEEEVRCSCEYIEYEITKPSCHEDNGVIDFLNGPLNTFVEIKWLRIPPALDWTLNEFSPLEDFSGATTGDYKFEIRVSSIKSPSVLCQFMREFSIESCTCEFVIDPQFADVENSLLCSTVNGTGSIQLSPENQRLFYNSNHGDYSDLNFNWTDASGNPLQGAGNSFNINNLSEGSYSVVVTDAADCTSSATFTVEGPDYYANISISEPSCPGAMDGEILAQALVDGNTENFSFIWSCISCPQTSTSQASWITNVAPGNYSVTISGNTTGCGSVETITLPGLIPSEITDISQNVTHSQCENEASVVELNAAGGYGPYNYLWSDGFIGDRRTFLEDVSYTVTVTDDCGQTFIKTIELNYDPNVFDPITNLSLEPIGDVDCSHVADGEATLSWSGGAPPFVIEENKVLGWSYITTTYDQERIVTYSGESSEYKIIDACGNETEPLFRDWGRCIGNLGIEVIDSHNDINNGLVIINVEDFDCEFDGNNTLGFGVSCSNCLDQSPDFWIERRLTFLPPSGTGVSILKWAKFHCLGPGEYDFVIDNRNTDCVIERTVTVLGNSTNEEECEEKVILIETTGVGFPGEGDGSGGGSDLCNTPNLGFTCLTGKEVKINFTFSNITSGFSSNATFTILEGECSATGEQVSSVSRNITDDNLSITLDRMIGTQCLIATFACNPFSPKRLEIECNLPIQAPDCPPTLSSNTPGETHSLEYFSPLVSGSQTPAVFLGPLSANDGEVASTSVTNVGENGFEVAISEFSYQDNLHGEEKVSHYAADMGTHDLGGLMVQAGEVTLVNQRWKWVYFPQPFNSIPVVMATQTSKNDPTPTTVRIHAIQKNRFLVKLQEEEGQDNRHDFESVSYVAFEQGLGMIDGKQVYVGKTARTVNHTWSDITFPGQGGAIDAAGSMFSNPPLLFVLPQTAYGREPAVVRYQNITESGVQIMLQEEQSADAETNHTTQTIGYVLIESSRNCDPCSVPITLLDVNTSEASCGASDGAAQVQVDGGTPPYSYDIGSGVIPFSSSLNQIDGLSPGDYTVNIIDSEGCEMSASFSVGESDVLNLLGGYTVSNENCEGRDFSILMDPKGGTPPFSYSWSTGSNAPSIGATGGRPEVTVTDSNGCSGTHRFDLTSPTQSSLQFDYGECTLGVYPKGIEPFTYLWSTGASSQFIDDFNLPQSFSVTVTDAAGCTFVKSKTLSGNDILNLHEEDAFCNADNGTIEAIIGCHDSYTYSWSNGKTTPKITDLAPGTYSVTVTDNNGGTYTGSESISMKDEVQLSQSGGVDGYFREIELPAGTEIDWTFRPLGITDGLIIRRSTGEIVLNTGGVSDRQSGNCQPFNNCCSSFFLGDISNGQSVDLITGSAIKMTGALTSTLISDGGSYTFEVIGDYCGFGQTSWYLTLSCTGNSLRLANEMTGNEEALMTSSTEIAETGKLELDIYPNPASSLVTIAKRFSNTEKYSVTFIDVNGRSVLDARDIDQNEFSVDVGFLTDGVYILRFELENGDTFAERLIIH